MYAGLEVEASHSWQAQGITRGGHLVGTLGEGEGDGEGVGEGLGDGEGEGSGDGEGEGLGPAGGKAWSATIDYRLTVKSSLQTPAMPWPKKFREPMRK